MKNFITKHFRTFYYFISNMTKSKSIKTTIIDESDNLRLKALKTLNSHFSELHNSDHLTNIQVKYVINAMIDFKNTDDKNINMYELIRTTGIFIGNSRIDNFPMFELNNTTYKLDNINHSFTIVTKN